MKLLLFSLKKTLRTPLYPLFLVGILLLPLLFYTAGLQTSVPPAAYYAENPADSDAALIIRYLKDAGFLAYDSEEALRADLARGLLEGGVIIPGDLSARLHRGDYQTSLLFIKSATALLPDLWINHATAALFAVYSPYISASILAEAQVSEEEIKAAYLHMMETGQLFHFEISTRDGKLEPDVARSRRFFLGALALLLFLGSYFCTSAPLWESVNRIRLRTGKSAALGSLYLPGVLLRGAGLFAAAAGACLICGEEGFVLPALGGLVAMLIFHFFLNLLPGKSWKDLTVFFITLFGLALSPMFIDLSLLLPFTGTLRLLLPPCWLWLLAGML